MNVAARVLVPVLTCCIATGASVAAGDLRDVLQDEHAAGAAHWIYNDLDEALQAARESGKPIFVTFRCVPCAACKSFDAEVAQGSERIRELASDHFIPLRIVEMKHVPLDLFRFDHDLNWAAMFINADKVVYGRYGTQSSDGPDAYNSIGSLEKAMLRALELHARYPAVAGSLEGKRPRPTPYRQALEMPGMRNSEKLARTTARDNCVHCHMIHDAENFAALEAGTWSTENLWRFPLPDTVGLEIDPADGRRIAAVADGSAADRAGLRAGTDVVAMAGQPVISIADMQWVLHHLGNGAEQLAVTVRDPGETENQTLILETEAGWKSATDFAWRGSMWSAPPKLRTWMPTLTAEEKAKRGIPDGRGAFLVKWINRGEPGGQAVYGAGVREGDVLVGFDGKPIPHEDGEPKKFHAAMKLRYAVGDTVTLTVLRDGTERDFEVELVE